MMKSTGIMAKMPEFMTCNNQKRKRNQARNNDSKDLFQAPPTVSRDQKAKIKLFGVTPAPKPKKRNIEEVGESIVTEMQPILEPAADIRAVISFCNPSRKQFAQVTLKSTYDTMKFLKDIILSKEKNISIKGKSVKVEANNSRYPKRSIEKKSYKEEEVSSDDEFLHCDDCESVYKGACPQHGPMLLVCDTKVEKGDPEGAVKSLPPFMSLGDSIIPKAGLGVWTEVPLPKGLIFGPYKGPKVPKNSKESGYAWQVWKGRRAHHLVEGADPSRSNWMRFVNCAQSEERQNMEALQFQGEVYYKIYKEVLPFCEMLVWYGDDYARHLGIETRRKRGTQEPQETMEITGHACDVCGSLFSSSSAMEAHRKRHPHMHPDRRHKCPQCNYSTDVETHLRKHLLTHTGERPHACSRCGKGFTQKSHLTNHLSVHTGERPFSCKVCGRAFNRSTNLVMHEKTHTNDKSYICTTCGKDFLQAGNLKKHERTHTLQRPYKCPHCNYRATQSSNLRSHVVSKHTRDFRHKCAECGKGFSRPSTLKEHFEKTHKKKLEEMD
ncbi:hypothetical protein JTE90_011487 [Oedothorax gibbosus]|uniref:C2H2-type domain-containing protein n=1 Tax=Oedothorax gibbosus TaxID=931172 RepID=A0AAV6VAY9_9ARAC|nr:hypothetical protein JTE90_011487 [Oedothorax gibbosus]